MAMWTVQDGDQIMVIESNDGRVSVDVLSSLPFLTNANGIRDMRRKLGFAIGGIEGHSTESP